jgi:nitroreductase
MELHDAIAGRRTIQRFQTGPVPDEVIDRALLAASWAPNHKTTWPFRFVLAGPVARERICQIGLRHKIAKRGPSPELEAAVRQDLLVPDRLVVVTQRVSEDPSRAQEDYATCACAVQNLMLSVFAAGYGSKWNTGALSRDPETASVLELGPQEKVVGLVLVGVPQLVPTAPKRPPMGELVRRVP